MASNAIPFDSATLEVSDGTFSAIAEITDFDPGFSADTIDATSIDSASHKQRIPGTRDATPSLTANYIPSDVGQGKLRTAYINRTAVTLRYRPQGSGSGKEEFELPVLVTDFGIGGSQGDKIPLSCSFEAQDVATRATQ